MKHLRNRRGQGTMEYVILAAIVLAILIAFRGPIMNAIGTKTTQVAATIAAQ